MKRQMCRMSNLGHETLAEWDTETVSKERLDEIEVEFKAKLKEGYFAADITVGDPAKGTDGKFIREFDPEAEILLIPRVQGGRC